MGETVRKFKGNKATRCIYKTLLALSLIGVLAKDFIPFDPLVRAAPRYPANASRFGNKLPARSPFSWKSYFVFWQLSMGSHWNRTPGSRLHNDSRPQKSSAPFWAVFQWVGVWFWGSGGKIAHRPSERCAQWGVMVNHLLSFFSSDFPKISPRVPPIAAPIPVPITGTMLPNAAPAAARLWESLFRTRLPFQLGWRWTVAILFFCDPYKTIYFHHLFSLLFSIVG